jgi:hypothetical protein
MSHKKHKNLTKITLEENNEDFKGHLFKTGLHPALSTGGHNTK